MAVSEATLKYRYDSRSTGELTMETVTVSSKFQVVIPRKVREENRIRPGDKMAVLVKHGVVHLVPVRPFPKSKGMFRGVDFDLSDLRDHSDRE